MLPSVIETPRNSNKGGPIRPLVVSLLGAAAVAAGVLLIRQKGPEPEAKPGVGSMLAGESRPGTISLERIRELGY